MQPPITHYKDEVVDNKSAEDLINSELDKEAKITSAQSSTPELKVLPVQKKDKKQTSSSSIVNAFKQKMSLNTTRIDLPSAGTSMEFKDISGGIQKELSKIALENDSRADIMYCAMLSMINRLAVDPKFDIRDYSEFERISIILTLQQINKMNPEIKFTCSKCGKENSYRLDTQKLLKKFSKTYKADTEIKVEVNGKEFTFVIGWSDVRNVEDFFKNYYKKYDNSSKSGKETMNQLSQVEYITMFINSIWLTELSDPEDTMYADLSLLTYPERVQILDSLPQTILYDDKEGVIAKIIENFVNPMNECFKYNDCSFCGAEQEGQLANMTDFMGY